MILKRKNVFQAKYLIMKKFYTFFASKSMTTIKLIL